MQITLFKVLQNRKQQLYATPNAEQKINRVVTRNGGQAERR
ncbi:hypothetical protein UUU_34540 [Klebsiella pneumoniae subsp. pneumoniae DSM 30104 = JCM 1662 = NBRC 14940]|nr:hypothetical protein UUU_34540 [Klebsiella pneumoniae subsp. pneumoniae DSM 30104 = JCM 1662 = NBRC 14940]